MKKIIFILIIFYLSFQNSNAGSPYFIYFKYILNESKAGKKAQEFLKSKLQNGLNDLKRKKRKFKKKKTNNTTKKLISQEEYKKGYRIKR